MTNTVLNRNKLNNRLLTGFFEEKGNDLLLKSDKESIFSHLSYYLDFLGTGFQQVFSRRRKSNCYRFGLTVENLLPVTPKIGVTVTEGGDLDKNSK